MDTYMGQLKLEIGGSYFDGRGVLFAGYSCNGLFYWDIVENKTFILGEFGNDPVWGKEMSQIAVRRKNIFFFLPFMAHGIPYFNADTKEIIYCSLPDCLENSLLNYCGYVEEKGFLYMFPFYPLEDILVLDMEQKKVTGIISDWNEKLINRYKIKEEQFMNGFLYQEEKIWISNNLAKGIFELALNSWEIQFHEWKEIVHPIILWTNDDGLWIEDQGESSIYHIGISGQIIEQYKLKTKSKQRLFSKVIRLKNGKRMLLPNYTNVLLIIDNNRRMHYRMIEKNTDEIEGRYLCYYYLEFEEEVWLLPHSQNDIIIVDLKDYSLKFKKLPTPDEWSQISNYISRMQRYESNYIMEDNINNITVQDFCDYVRAKKENTIVKDITKSYGMKIWEEVNK